MGHLEAPKKSSQIYLGEPPFLDPMALNFIMGISRPPNEIQRAISTLKTQNCLIQGRNSYRSHDIGQKYHLGCPLGSVWAFWDLNEIRTPNYFHGSGMAAFMGVGHGFKVVSRFVSKIMAKNSFWLPIGLNLAFLGSLFNDRGTLHHLSYYWR